MDYLSCRMFQWTLLVVSFDYLRALSSNNDSATLQSEQTVHRNVSDIYSVRSNLNSVNVTVLNNSFSDFDQSFGNETNSNLEQRHSSTSYESGLTSIGNITGYILAGNSSKNYENVTEEYELYNTTLVEHTTPYDDERVDMANISTKSSEHTSTTEIDLNVPYFVHNDQMKKMVLTHENGHQRMPFQHHLQLVPMDDEPFGTVIMKDNRFMVSVLIPIGVGSIGAAMIIVTVLSLRYIARRRAVGDMPVNDDISVNEQPSRVGSISGEQTDRVFLLLGEEDEI
ncbi:hypothetical protein MAR_000977 [Mya arenaria]|uniref:Uncharacterized protein n=1 Tax=Mya arenaria TaxID=6604 RepID=A0ABY7FCN8_MYAAR|nr:hypothetical protein MAR_000977 [Mya arenaria]